MLQNVSHFVDVQDDSEILYESDFGYMFNFLNRNGSHLLPTGPRTVHYLRRLGTVMADQEISEEDFAERNSTIPSIYTYLGQFIDHDITARTDRNTTYSSIGDGPDIYPLNPIEIVQNLRNGRRPKLDLDSVFGEGPSFSSKYTCQADKLFDNRSLNLFLVDGPGNFIDLKRDKKKNYKAIIADARNDENLIISQLHATFLKMFNKINDNLDDSGLSNADAYSRARQLCRWAYQYVVLNDYLPTVCDPDVVNDILRNGPFFYNTSFPYMPLEFSVSAFRFGHSMIRPSYMLNEDTTMNIMKILDPAANLIDTATGNIRADVVVDWANFVGENPANLARKIDPFIAKGLFDLSKIAGTPPPPSVLASLTQRNLLRGYLLSIPTGQAIAEAMRIMPLTETELVDGLNEEQTSVMQDSDFVKMTPLWFYILQEAKVQKDGNTLGYVGSKLVGETITGLVKGDFNSYFNNTNDAHIESDGILLPDNGMHVKISTIKDILMYAEVLTPDAAVPMEAEV
ncbi:MAG: hypothetical protein CMO01_28495 [Thalassobius sp.]|nr:hypothetical protein [Thalassovita sp.]